MKLLLLASFLLCLPAVGLAQKNRRAPTAKPTAAATNPKQRKLFPYKYAIDDLPNGLRLVTVPTDQPNLHNRRPHGLSRSLLQRGFG
jgi:hypothetical protein